MSLTRFTVHISSQETLEMSANICAYDYQAGILFASIFGYASQIKIAASVIKKGSCEITVGSSGHFRVQKNEYEIVQTHLSESDYSHMIIWKKDHVTTDGYTRLHATVYLQTEQPESYENISQFVDEQIPEELSHAVFNKLYSISPIPLIPAWSEFITRSLINNVELRNVYTRMADNRKFTVLYLEVNSEDLVTRISQGLRDHVLSIRIDDRPVYTSEFMKNVVGIDSYLHNFAEVLTKKIQRFFKPLFIPGTGYSDRLQEFNEYANYKDGINLYHAQQDVAQALSECLNKQKNAFLIGECGVGKTSITLAAIHTHNSSDKNMVNVVMCPTHLVHTWKREIESRSPLSRAIIVKDFSHFLKYVPDMKTRSGIFALGNVWFILSKETAKLGSELRPAAVWSEKRKCYVCPDCGQILTYRAFVGEGRQRRAVHVPLGKLDFRKQSPRLNNIRCTNTVRHWDPSTQTWTTKTCGAALWQPVIKETLVHSEKDPKDRWLKTGKAGWLQKRHLSSIFNSIVDKEDYTNDDTLLLSELSDPVNEGKYPVQVAPKRYPISKYVNKFLKGMIDYVILDECHLYSSRDSLQGESAGELVFAAQHSLSLTGTLLNGYASGIYHILCRLFASQMKHEGYDYGSSADFAKEYGVTRATRSFVFNEFGGRTRRGIQYKELPGVSPLVFTKFLLENAAFISLDDISEALPAYEEIPIPITMDSDLQDAYRALEQDVGAIFRDVKIGRKVMGQVVNLLSLFPDMPYGQPPVIHPETGATLVVPPELPNGSEAVRAKDLALLEIISNKVQAGEKVLVYYHWTNRTDIATRLHKLIESYGFKTATLTNAVKAQDREKWIHDQVKHGAQVLLCNPALIETGLTLLDFTTIIYYQLGYNLYTMRQASRRSWRINQDQNVEVYFLYYENTAQEQALSLMATKLQASMAIEGKFDEEGLNAMSNNEDILTEIASSITKGIHETVDVQVFQKNKIERQRQVKEDIAKEIILQDDTMTLTPVPFVNSNGKNIGSLVPEELVHALAGI